MSRLPLVSFLCLLVVSLGVVYALTRGFSDHVRCFLGRGDSEEID